MVNPVRSREPEDREQRAAELVQVLSPEAMLVFGKTEGLVDTLIELYALVCACAGSGEDLQGSGSARSPAGEAADPDGTQRRLVDRVDHPFRLRARAREGRVYAETPGEICHRLMRVRAGLDRDIPVQHHREAAEDARQLALERAHHQFGMRIHLQAHLQQLLADLEQGVAVLPPPGEFRSAFDPYVDPLTGNEVPIDLYATARKARDLPGTIRHILGLACNGHGASLCYLGRDGTVRSSVFDRWIGTKYTLLMARREFDAMCDRDEPVSRQMYELLAHSFGSFPPCRLFEDVFADWLSWLLADVDVAPEAIDLLISSESNFVTSAFSLAPSLKRWLPRARVVTDVEHHTVHQRQAFWQSGFQEAAVITLDTCGESLARIRGRKIAGTISVMDAGGTCRVLREFLFPYSSAGLIYSIVNHHLGFSQGQEGKTMGLAPYGKPFLYQELVKRLRLFPDGSFDFLNYRELEGALRGYETERPRRRDAAFTQRHCDIAFAGQAIIEDIVVNTFRAALGLTGLNRIVYAGGLALNSVANEVGNRAVRPSALYIAPNPGDAGQALGGALYAAHELAGWPPRKAEIPEYLGPRYRRDRIESAVRASPGHKVHLREPLGVLARCIANGHIVARFAGGAEFGPRALGNRSILADPRRHDMKDFLNARVKHREGFRPFAPSVLLEHASDWFGLDGRSPYMLRVVHVPQALRNRIPAVVHVDGTARVQTVDREENPEYWDLIRAFFRITGVPLVLNTSFNIAGRPIVEKPEDAVACFASTDIDVLMLGEWIVSKRPLEVFETKSR